MAKNKDMSILLKEAKDNIGEAKELQKQLNKKLKKVFDFLIDNAFESVPGLTEIQWDQYAPFEIGTEFSVHQVYFEYDGKNASSEADEFLDVLENFLYENKDFLHGKFGDDSRVIITREGISLEAVEHS
jgi:hypothetical protein